MHRVVLHTIKVEVDKSLFQILHLVIEVFGCLHKHAYVFLHGYANAIWSLKGPEGFHLFVLIKFFHLKISITLQRMQTSSILSSVITIGLTTY
jgi:hypothetical protein